MGGMAIPSSTTSKTPSDSVVPWASVSSVSGRRIRAEYTKRNATRRHESVMRSSTPRTRPAQDGS